MMLWILASCSQPNNSNPSSSQINSLNIETPDHIVAPGYFEPEAGIINIAAEVSGIVSNIYVKAGDSVKANSPLIELDHTDAELQVSHAKAQLSVQQQQLQQALLACQQDSANFLQASKNFSRTRDLFLHQAVTAQQLDDDSMKMVMAQMQLAQQQANIRSLQEQIQASEIELRQAIQHLASYRISAPKNGLVIAVSTKIHEYVAPGNPLLSFAPQSPMIFQCEVDQLFADDVQNGQPAKIVSLNGKDTLAGGKIVFVSPYLQRKSILTGEPGEKQDRRVREVKILIDHTNQPIIIHELGNAILFTHP